MTKAQITVIALGGSLIVPHLSDNGGVNVAFLKKFRTFLIKETRKKRKFIVIAGGGRTARMYRDSASRIKKVKNDDLDWVGIAATKLNAELLRVVFAGAKENISIAAGVAPGWSTDYIAVKLAQQYGATDVIIAGDTPYVYEKDPRKFPAAKALPELTWKEYEKLIPKKWTPGFSSPVDPIATKLAKKLKLQVKIIKGSELKNFQAAIEGKKFKGTIIR